MYIKLCAFREETEEIQLVAGLITFLLLDRCEVPNISCWIHIFMMSCMPRQLARSVFMLTNVVTLGSPWRSALHSGPVKNNLEKDDFLVFFGLTSTCLTFLPT